MIFNVFIVEKTHVYLVVTLVCYVGIDVSVELTVFVFWFGTEYLDMMLFRNIRTHKPESKILS